MDRYMPVWDFSTPSMGLQELGLPDLYEPEHNEVQDALCVFNMPTMPTLLDTSGPVADAEAFQKATARHRARRSLSMEQKQVSNREHQRRFRERSKARSQAIEAQLATTAKELQELKSRHHQLEVLLEQAHQSSQNQLFPPTSDAEEYASHRHKFRDIDTSALLSISVQGRRSSLTCDEVRTMSTEQFSALWTAYIHELGQCLLNLDADKDGHVAGRLLLLSVEGLRLVGRRLLHNPAAHKALITANMVQGLPTLLHLDTNFYTNLVALLDLSGEQVSDLMHLRRLYFTKRALLALQRKALVHSMASYDSQLGHPSDNCTAAAEVAARLKDNAFEDTTVLYRIARAVWVGILSSKQLALIFVHAYPYMPVLESILDHIAAREGYPVHEEVIASAHSDPMTAAWRDFDEYAMYIHTNMFSEERAVYVPLSRHLAPC
ncbi:hypothetical protein ABBQ32_011407 [Trebouxia sp. C0010 RCD-2024]